MGKGVNVDSPIEHTVIRIYIPFARLLSLCYLALALLLSLLPLVLLVLPSFNFGQDFAKVPNLIVNCRPSLRDTFIQLLKANLAVGFAMFSLASLRLAWEMPIPK